MFEKDGKKFLVMGSREIKSALTNIAKLYSEMIMIKDTYMAITYIVQVWELQ